MNRLKDFKSSSNRLEDYPSQNRLADFKPDPMPKETRPDLLNRALKGIVRKTVIDPIKAIETKSRVGELGTLLDSYGLIRQFKEEKGRSPTKEEADELLKYGKILNLQSTQDAYKWFDLPPPEGLSEKGVELVTGVTSFITKLALAKKILGGQGLATDVMSFEMVHEVDGGTPGVGALLGYSLGAFGKMPAPTLARKGFRMAGQSATLAGFTAAAGGTPEDIAVAALLPPVMNTLGMFPVMFKGKMTDVKLAKELGKRYPNMQDVPIKSRLNWARAMRDAWKLGRAVSQKDATAWGKKHGKNLYEFSEHAKTAFKGYEKMNLQGVAQKGFKEALMRTYPKISSQVADKAIEIYNKQGLHAAGKYVSAASIIGDKIVPEKIGAKDLVAPAPTEAKLAPEKPVEAITPEEAIKPSPEAKEKTTPITEPEIGVKKEEIVSEPPVEAITKPEAVEVALGEPLPISKEPIMAFKLGDKIIYSKEAPTHSHIPLTERQHYQVVSLPKDPAGFISEGKFYDRDEWVALRKAKPEAVAPEAKYELSTPEGRKEASISITARATEIAKKLEFDVSSDELLVMAYPGKHTRGTSHGDAGISLFLAEDATKEQIDRVLIHELGHTMKPTTVKGLANQYEYEKEARKFEEEQIAKLKELEAKPEAVAPEGTVGMAELTDIRSRLDKAYMENDIETVTQIKKELQELPIIDDNTQFERNALLLELTRAARKLELEMKHRAEAVAPEAKGKVSAEMPEAPEIAKSFIDKYPKMTRSEFADFWVSEVQKLWSKENKTDYNILLRWGRQIVGKDELLAGGNIWEKLKGIDRKIYSKDKITITALNSDVLPRIDETGRNILTNIVDFIAEKYPNKELHITIGTQPISIAGDKGFRITPPDTKSTVENMFPYDYDVIKIYKQLQDSGVPSQILWTTHDIFHELGHTLEVGDEKACDRFAAKLTEEYLKAKPEAVAPEAPKIQIYAGTKKATEQSLLSAQKELEILKKRTDLSARVKSVSIQATEEQIEAKKTMLERVEKGLAKFKGEEAVAPEAKAAIKEPWEMTRAEYKQNVYEKDFWVPETRAPGKTQAQHIQEIEESIDRVRKIDISDAVKEGKPVPHEVLEEYKSEKWAQEALKKAEALKEAEKVEKKEVELLAEEARKYKTVDEFVGAMKKKKWASDEQAQAINKALGATGYLDLEQKLKDFYKKEAEKVVPPKKVEKKEKPPEPPDKVTPPKEITFAEPPRPEGPNILMLQEVEKRLDEKAMLSEKRKLRQGARRLAKQFIGKTDLKKMSEEELAKFGRIIARLPEPTYNNKGQRIPPSIPRTTAITKLGEFEKEYAEPTIFKLLHAPEYYAEKLGVKSLVEKAEAGKIRFSLEYQKLGNKVDGWIKQIEKLGKTTLKEKAGAKLKNIPTKAVARFRELLDTHEEPPASLGPKEKELFNNFRELSRWLLKRENAIRESMELKPIQYRKAYVRHVADGIAKEILAGRYPFPQGRKFWSEQIVAKKIYNAMEMHRKLKEDLEQIFSKDLGFVTKSMLWTALKEIHLTQPIRYLEQQLTARGKDTPVYKSLSPSEKARWDKITTIPARTRRWVREYVRTTIRGQQSETDQDIEAIFKKTGLKGLLNIFLKPFGRVLSHKPYANFVTKLGRAQIMGVMGGPLGGRPRQIIRNKFQTLQNMALYPLYKETLKTYAPIRGLRKTTPELERLLNKSLFLKAYTGTEEWPVDIKSKIAKSSLMAYQWSAMSNARQAMECAYWGMLPLFNNPKFKHHGWSDPERIKIAGFKNKEELLLKEMEFGASATQHNYTPIGMPEIFRHKTLTPLTRLQSWWMNHYFRFTEEALHRAFTGRPTYIKEGGPTLPWKYRLGWLRYVLIAVPILNAMRYQRSYLFGAAPTGVPPSAQFAQGLYYYVVGKGSGDDRLWKRGKKLMKDSSKTFIPGYMALKDYEAIWSGRKDLSSLLFYKKR